MYVRRNAQGAIDGYSTQSHPEMLEEVADEDPALMAFMSYGTGMTVQGKAEAEASGMMDGKNLLKAFALVVRDELVNIASAQPGYSAPTAIQLKQAVVSKYKGMFP